MARGWESKSVESQIEDRQERQSRGPERSRADIELERKRESLESSQRGLLRELETAQSPLRRSSLEQALKHLEGEIAKLR
jgi:hypothetical protein